MKLSTHLGINASLCGTVVLLEAGKATVKLTATVEMAADHCGLVHGGFIFGAADYAAMAAVNHPHVVLGAAETKFLKATRVGETVSLAASVVESDGKRRRVEVVGTDARSTIVFTGMFTCFVLEKHVLDR